MNLRDVPIGHLFRQIGERGLDGKPDRRLFLVLHGFRYVDTTWWCLLDTNFNKGQDVEVVGHIKDFLRNPEKEKTP